MESWEVASIMQDISINNKETIESLNDIIETLIKEPKDKIIKDLIYERDKFADYYNVCPECGQDLEVIHKDYEASEYQGMEVSEELNTWGCNSCGWIKED